MTVTLYPFQEEGVTYLLKHHYAILGDQMGLGKTIQAIEVMNRTELSTLIICPAFLKKNWEEEIKKFYRHNRAVKIISYAKLKTSAAMFKWADLVICDEFHYLKNIKAKRTEYFHANMAKYSPERFIGLTGTAIKNRVGEFYSLLVTMDYNPYGTSGPIVSGKFRNYWSFCDKFSHRHEFKIHGRKVIKYDGMKNIPELKQLMTGKYIRRKANDVLDLPPIIRKFVPVKGPDDKEMTKVWNHMERTGELPHFSTSKMKSAFIKVDVTCQYVKNLIDEGVGPVLVFTDHPDTAYAIAGFFDQVPVTGRMAPDERHRMVKRFQCKEMDVLVATTGAMSVGHTLTSASNLVFNDVPWTPGDLAQAEARIRRISQTKTCVVHYIHWGKIDKRIIDTLNKKIKILGEVL